MGTMKKTNNRIAVRFCRKLLHVEVWLVKKFGCYLAEEDRKEYEKLIRDHKRELRRIANRE